jgi:sulfite reductase alpha subunit-like flavoprotein
MLESVGCQHMAPDVREAFAKILGGSKGAEEGQRLLQGLIESKRYREDVWAS